MQRTRVEAFQEADGTWRLESDRGRLKGPTLEACTGQLEDSDLLVEAHPWLVGVAETADLLRWDKRRVITYINRGSFPEPLQSLAGGRIWALDDVVAFKEAFEARRR